MTYHANMVFDDSDLPPRQRRSPVLVAEAGDDRLVIRKVAPQLPHHAPLFRCNYRDHVFERPFSEQGLNAIKRDLRTYFGAGNITKWTVEGEAA